MLKSEGKQYLHKPTVGLYSLHDSTNENGLRLIDFAAGRQMAIKSTYFMHKQIHLETWHSPDGRTRNQIEEAVWEVATNTIGYTRKQAGKAVVRRGVMMMMMMIFSYLIEILYVNRFFLFFHFF
jgi:hypothetical protein